MITDDVYLLLNAAQRESFSPSGPKISVTGWYVFVTGWHLCHPVVVVVLKDALAEWMQLKFKFCAQMHYGRLLPAVRIKNYA